MRRGVRQVAENDGEPAQRLPVPGPGRPGPARWSWRSRSCGRARISPAWLWSAAPRGAGADLGGGDLLPAGRVHARGGRVAATLGVTQLSKSQVWRWPRPGRPVAEFRNRPLDGGPYTFVWIDALTHEGPRGRMRIVNVARPGRRRGRRRRGRGGAGGATSPAEEAAGWLASSPWALVARGLSVA